MREFRAFLLGVSLSTFITIASFEVTANLFYLWLVFAVGVCSASAVYYINEIMEDRDG